jgi:hypothetical protein
VTTGKEISIAVRFIEVDQFFCTTLLGYQGTRYRDIESNEQNAFDVRDSNDSSKEETNQEFG